MSAENDQNRGCIKVAEKVQLGRGGDSLSKGGETEKQSAITPEHPPHTMKGQKGRGGHTQRNNTQKEINQPKDTSIPEKHKQKEAPTTTIQE